jgi:hypothetical protein
LTGQKIYVNELIDFMNDTKQRDVEHCYYHDITKQLIYRLICPRFWTRG